MAKKHRREGQDAVRGAIGYVRVSTQRQRDEGLSEDAQVARINGWAVANGFTLTEIIREAESGRTVEGRPEFQRAMAAACDRGLALVAVKLDRVARNTEEAIAIAKQLNRSGADLVLLREQVDTTTAIGRCLFRFMASMAELESDQIGERVQAVFDGKRERGESLGKCPFGFTAIDGKLVPHESESLARRFLLETYAKTRSFELTRKALVEAGHKPRMLGWDPQRVRLAWSGSYGPEYKSMVRARLGDAIPNSSACRDVAAELGDAGVSPPPTRWTRGSILRIVESSRGPAAVVSQ